MATILQSTQKELQQKSMKNLQLIKMIQYWIQNHDPTIQKTSPSFRFKFNLQKILPLPARLLEIMILYVCYVKFQFIVQDFCVDLRVETNLELKGIYTQEFYHGKWKRQFQFQFTMVYLTKYISNFICEHFPMLKNNENLESQLFVIMYKVFIGNEIGTKFYHLVAKKYIKKLNTLKQARKKCSISSSIRKKDSILTVQKFSLNSIGQVMCPVSSFYGNTKHRLLFNNSNLNSFSSTNFMRNNLRMNSIKYKNSFIKTDTPPSRSNLDLFNEQLKKSLYVDPLPVIQPKKIDISRYQRQKKGQNKILVSQKRKSLQKISKPVQLRTNKITSSMQILLPFKSSNKQMNPGFMKPKLISISRQLNSKHYCLTSTNNRNDSDQITKAQIIGKQSQARDNSFRNNGKMTYQQWNQQLGKIKSSSKISNFYDKQNICLGRSFYAKSSQNKSLHEYSSQKSKLNTYSPQTNHNHSQQGAYQNYKTQTGQVFLKTQHYSHYKSQFIDSMSQLQEHKFQKLWTRTTVAQPVKYQIIDKQKASPSEVQSKGNSQLKLYKICKLKLKKLDFIKSCKNRQLKICSTEDGYQLLGLSV